MKAAKGKGCCSGYGCLPFVIFFMILGLIGKNGEKANSDKSKIKVGVVKQIELPAENSANNSKKFFWSKMNNVYHNRPVCSAGKGELMLYLQKSELQKNKASPCELCLQGLPNTVEHLHAELQAKPVVNLNTNPKDTAAVTSFVPIKSVNSNLIENKAALITATTTKPASAPICYISKSGRKYHKNPSCSVSNSFLLPIYFVSELKKRHSPCRNCWDVAPLF